MGLFSLARQFILRENIVIILQRGLKKLEELGIVEKVEGACKPCKKKKGRWGEKGNGRQVEGGVRIFNDDRW